MFVLQSSAKQALSLPLVEAKSDIERVTNLPKVTIKWKKQIWNQIWSAPKPPENLIILPHFLLPFYSFIRNALALHCTVIVNRDGTPLQYSRLENPMDGGAWWAAVHGVAKSRTRLSDFTFTFHFHALEKEMATHSSVLTWRTPGILQGRWGRLVCCCLCDLWGRTESDTTEAMQQQQQRVSLSVNCLFITFAHFLTQFPSF